MVYVHTPTHHNSELLRLENAIATSTLPGGGLSQAQILGFLRRAKGGFSSAFTLSLISFALTIAALRLPFWEVTNSSIDVQFMFPDTVQVCSSDPTLPCRLTGFSDPAWSQNGQQVNMQAASRATFAMLIMALFPLLVTAFLSLALMRRVTTLLGATMWTDAFAGAQLHTQIQNMAAPLVVRAARKPRLPLRSATLAMLLLVTSCAVYLGMVIQFVHLAFNTGSGSTTPGSAVNSNPSIGFIFCAVVALTSILIVGSIGRAATLLGIVEMSMPAGLVGFAGVGMGGGAGAPVMTDGYVAMPAGTAIAAPASPYAVSRPLPAMMAPAVDPSAGMQVQVQQGYYPSPLGGMPQHAQAVPAYGNAYPMAGAPAAPAAYYPPPAAPAAVPTDGFNPTPYGAKTL